MRPIGRPPMPRARSTASEPVDTAATFILLIEPRRMTLPSPNCLVMAEIARLRFFSRSALESAPRLTAVSLAISACRKKEIRNWGFVINAMPNAAAFNLKTENKRKTAERFLFWTLVTHLSRVRHDACLRSTGAKTANNEIQGMTEETAKILVVDDEEDVTELVAYHMEANGWLAE